MAETDGIFKPDFQRYVNTISGNCNMNTNLLRATSALIFALIGTLSNTLVIIVTVITLKKSKPCKILIGALSVSDLIFSILQIVTSWPYLKTCNWIYGSFMCSFLPMCISTSSTISVGFILIIAVERYVGIIYPFSRGLTPRKIILMVIQLLVVSVLIDIPYVLNLQVKGNQCIDKWSNRNFKLIYSWASLLLTFLFPIIVISVLYINIILSLRRSIKEMTLVNNNGQFQQQRHNENKRIMKILVSVLSVFTFLTFPNKFYWILKDYGFLKNSSKEIKEFLHLFGSIPYSLQVTANPIIYSIIDKRFRQTLKKIFFSRFISVDTNK